MDVRVCENVWCVNVWCVVCDGVWLCVDVFSCLSVRMRSLHQVYFPYCLPTSYHLPSTALDGPGLLSTLIIQV